MAIYWIDPHTTTNGTGTFASPYSIASTTRATFSPGDELRVKSVYLTSLLTATVYTATATNNYQITLTAGGGGGADFVTGDYIYFPDYDTFLRVNNVAANLLTLQINGYTLLPITTTAAITNLTVRKVNAATYGVSTTGVGYFLATNTVDNVTITDGWVDETTQVTDGTAKTIVRSSSTATTINYYIDGNVSGRNNSTGLNYDLSNTYFLPHPATSPSVIVNLRSSNATLNVAYICHQSTSIGCLAIGQTTTPVQNSTITIDNLVTYYGLSQMYGSDITINIGNIYSAISYFLFNTSYTALQSVLNLTLNVTNIFSGQINQPAMIEAYNVANTTLNITGRFSNYSNQAISYLFHGYGNISINFGAGFTYRYNREATLDSSILSRGAMISSTTQANKVIIPTLNLPDGWTVTQNNYVTTSTFSTPYAATFTEKNAPTVWTIEYPSQPSTLPQGYTNYFNVLVTHRDGSDPYEILGIGGNGYLATTTGTVFPIVRRDTVTYRTAGPSLRCNLTTRTAAYWSNNTTAIKSIRIPVTAGVQRTVTGYIRTDMGVYANNDCRMVIDYQQTILANTSITTGCIDNWEQFTLTFTPTYTGEAKLLWEMYYATTGNFWLDDLTVT